MYEEDEDLEYTKQDSILEKVKSLFLVKVAIQYGLAYALIFALLLLSWVMILLPATIKWGYEKTSQIINWLSKGDPEWTKFYWGVLLASWGAVIVIFIASKICDYVLDKKYGKTKKEA